MKRSLGCALLMASSFLSWADFVPPSIQSLIQRTDPNMNVGIMVVDLNTGANLFEKQAKKTFVPASNMKLFSEAVALLALGSEYQIPTTLSTDAKTLTQGRLNGSLYLHLSPDPSFTHQALFVMLEQLKKWGVNQITGDIVVQSDLAVVSPYPPGMVARDAQFSYGAPVGPLILDENRLTVTTNPASQVGQLAYVETSSPNGVFNIDNHVETKASGKGCGVSVAFDEQGVLHVRGCVGVGQMAIIQRVPVKYPVSYLRTHILYQLAQNNIQLNGQVKMGGMPTNTLLVTKHLSPPIKQLMSATLKPSDNLYANSLHLLAANQISKHSTTWAEAQNITRQFLQQQTGIDMSDAVFADGSGLSRLNKVTPYQTISLLTFLYHKFPLAFEYIAALPISGLDGTLQKRLNLPYQKGLIRAKTGTMTGILSLSGYLITKNDHNIAFTIYINTLPGTKPAVSGRYRGFIDSVCSSLLLSQPKEKFSLFGFSHPKSVALYQKPPNGVEANRMQQGYWRGLELGFKRELTSLPVTVLYHPQELVILDKGSHEEAVWRAIKKLKSQKRFSVMVESLQAPNLGSDALGFLWMQSQPQDNVTRRWTIRPMGS